MLTIVCGEDSIASRDYFLSLKHQFIQKQYEIKNININEIIEIQRWLSESPSLFSQTRAYFTENLNKKINRRTNKKLIEIIEKLIKNKEIEIIDWEGGVGSRELKISKGVNIKEFKPSENIFKLLDACTPHYLSQFLNIMANLDTDASFIFIMLIRHIRNLILIKNKIMPPKMQSWQFRKLQFQANLWNSNKLISFYESLYKLEVSVKTSKNPYSLKDSLDLLAAYYL